MRSLSDPYKYIDLALMRSLSDPYKYINNNPHKSHVVHPPIAFPITTPPVSHSHPSGPSTSPAIVLAKAIAIGPCHRERQASLYRHSRFQPLSLLSPIFNHDHSSLLPIHTYSVDQHPYLTISPLTISALTISALTISTLTFSVLTIALQITLSATGDESGNEDRFSLGRVVASILHNKIMCDAWRIGPGHIFSRHHVPRLHVSSSRKIWSGRMRK